jgi:hypothetical protein
MYRFYIDTIGQAQHSYYNLYERNWTPNLMFSNGSKMNNNLKDSYAY